MQSLAKLIVWIGITSLAYGCSSLPKAETPGEERYLTQVEATPLEFTISMAELDVAIDRAVEWLGKYHQLEFTEADRQAFKDLLRKTNSGVVLSPMRYSIGDLGSHGYGVAFTLANTSVNVHVTHEHAGGFGLGKAVARNARILAHYIRTGELVPRLIKA